MKRFTSFIKESGGMSDAAHELALYADNHAHLHRTSHQPIVANLQKKKAKGIYDHEKAKKLWGYHADRAAHAYAKEHGDGRPWHKMFSTSDRKQAAAHFADSARDEHLSEETTPTSGVTNGVIDVGNDEVRATINAALASTLADRRGISSALEAVTVVQKVLANYHIFLEKKDIPATNRGRLIYPVDQFGAKVGMTNTGQVVSVPKSPYSVVIDYNMVFGRFIATARILNNEQVMTVVYEDVEQLDEISKSTLKSYIKKASHDVATKSAATGRYGDRANRVAKEMKDGNYDNFLQGKRDDATADKFFKKSWKRRKGIEKAVDKLDEEKKTDHTEQLDELSKSTLMSYGGKALAAARQSKTEKIRTKRLNGVNRASSKLWPNQFKDSPLKSKVVAKEETEQLDEISKETKARYLSKADVNWMDMWRNASKKRIDKRRAGMQKASIDTKGEKRFADYDPKTKQITTKVNEEVLEPGPIKVQSVVDQVVAEMNWKGRRQSTNVDDRRAEGKASPYAAYSMVDRAKTTLDKTNPVPKTGTSLAIGAVKQNPKGLESVVNSAKSAMTKAATKQ